MKDPPVFERQTPGCRIGANDGRVEINQMSVVRRGALRRTDAVWVMTCRAWDFVFEVVPVLGEALVVQNAVSTVAFVT